MVAIKIKCVHCQSKEVVKMGYQKNGAPRCKFKNCGKIFQREYINKGAKPETKEMIIKMAVNGSEMMKCGVEYITKKLRVGFGMQSITKMAMLLRMF